jgi:hypothetical protein
MTLNAMILQAKTIAAAWKANINLPLMSCPFKWFLPAARRDNPTIVLIRIDTSRTHQMIVWPFFSQNRLSGSPRLHFIVEWIAGWAINANRTRIIPVETHT